MPADHQQLLELLRALRQGVDRARLEARRHDEVAGALGRALDQRRASRPRRSRCGGGPRGWPGPWPSAGAGGRSIGSRRMSR